SIFTRQPHTITFSTRILAAIALLFLCEVGVNPCLWECSNESKNVINCLVAVLEGILHASALYKEEKKSVLDRTSIDLNMLRMFVRLSKDTKLIEAGKYAQIQQQIDEMSRMLGGWIKHYKE
ncbi:MAG TPA: four helix bundle protein, partial [Patescibacteria group bacterium]|nr:four helix bundle protein [Patescibacteria group bacterium]